MIIWLASYPRSGNTMLRIMLHQVFGCKTYAKSYLPAKNAILQNAAFCDVTGTTPLPGPWEECFEAISCDSQTYLVKTHDLSKDERKAVYVVRNGFAAICSHGSYLLDFRTQDF